jgi:Fur family transcriptional regulator, peroxide stress response regulator
MKKREDCLTHLNAVCRDAGMKLTQQRIEVYSELAHASDHPSPESLHRKLLPRMPRLSLDTVYRTLTTLAQYNLVQRVETFQSQARYEIVQPPHHHLICRECRQISDFPWSSFDTTKLPKETELWGVVEKKSAVLTGICSECRKKSIGKQQNKTVDRGNAQRKTTKKRLI